MDRRKGLIILGIGLLIYGALRLPRFGSYTFILIGVACVAVMAIPPDTPTHTRLRMIMALGSLQAIFGALIYVFAINPLVFPKHDPIAVLEIGIGLLLIVDTLIKQKNAKQVQE